jgi:non-reducing end alpha-L-arabinofuranosidase
MSGTWTQCDLISVAIEGLGFKDVKCVDGVDGSCNCPAKIDNAGNMGLIVADPQASGDYTVAGNLLGTGENMLTGTALEYSYCVANGKMTMTPKTASPPMTGTVVLQKAGGTGGNGGSGGTGGRGGTTTTGGTTTSGSAGKGGTTTSSGTPASGGATGGTSSTGGTTVISGNDAPCDILESAKTPCVAAYSMVRAIYKAYNGPAYQVRSKANTSSTKDVPLLEAGGIADSKVQDDFCAASGCTLSKIYDQSPKGNHLALTPDVYWLTLTGTTRAGGGGRQKEADVKNNPKITVNGKPVYGLKFMGGQGNAYRVLKPTGTAVADEPEWMYSVFDTTVYNGSCCNDFGNAETTGNPDSFASMEAIYYGNATMWGKGGGNGPWFSCDYEAVISPGKSGTDTSIPSINIKKFATFIIKGFSGGTISLKFGDAEKGPLTTQYEGARVNGTKTMKKQGSIILGTGGDGSFYSTGVWFEGAMTAGCSSDKAVDDAIQANIVAAQFVAP